MINDKRDYMRLYMQKYRKDHATEWKEYHRKKQAEWAVKNQEKIKAHQLLNYRVKSGEIKRLPCEVCGEGRSQAHHINYKQPLKVKWFCDLHHKATHRRLI